MKISQPVLSIVIPTWNEAKNIEPLVLRINAVLTAVNLAYEIIFVDDRSTDESVIEIKRLALAYPIKLVEKTSLAPQGKATSLLLGFRNCQAKTIAMIDADLQYPPEAIPAMVKKIEAGSDLVIANRVVKSTNVVRRLASFIFHFLFVRLLHGFSVDVQSGLKVFRREIVERIPFTPVSEWMFDLEFLLSARVAGYKISTSDIAFAKRNSGKAKIGLIRASLEMAWTALVLKMRVPKIIPFHPDQIKKQGVGFHYKGQKYISHSHLPQQESAFFRLSKAQKWFIVLGIFYIGLLFILNSLVTTIAFLGLLTLLYFTDLGFNALLIMRSFKNRPEIVITAEEINYRSQWPTYTVFCPLYKEWQVLPQFIKAIEALDYPKDKLQIMLLLEEDDKETIKHTQIQKLPDNFEVVVVPHSIPKTKPKALNYGLKFARGEYAVVFDAEDVPEPEQLKKSVQAFAKADASTICIQAKLNFYNPKDNLLTRLFTSEYSLWFELILTGLQLIEAPIPLGGTSNHFRVVDLKRLDGWDAFNVTEDCDLGLRLSKRGYKTAIIDSVTMEEANSDLGNWFGQRSRWIKGYIQTYLVHMRSPLTFGQKQIRNVFNFQLVVGAKVLSLFINPFMWILTISYFVFRPIIGPTIETFFPAPVLYMGVLCLIFGNFIYMYSYMIGIAKRKEWWLTKYVFFVPFYWLAMSLAAWKALGSLIVSPFYWSKTVHGLHLKSPPIPATVSYPKAYPRSTLSTGGILVTATMVANVFNYLTNAYLGRVTPVEEFGLISLISSLVALTQIPLSSFSRTITHQAAYLLGRTGAPVKKLWFKLRGQALFPSIFVVGLWLTAIPFLAKFFNSETILPFILITPLWAIGIFAAVDSGFLSGNLRFVPIAVMTISEVIGKFILTVILVNTGQIKLMYIAYPASSLISFTIGWYFARKLKTKPTTQEISLSLPKRFFGTTLLSKLSSTAFLSFDVILAKHYLSPTAAGQYALLALVGKMIYFLGTLFSQFVIPLVSHQEGAGGSSKKVFKTLLTLTGLSVTLGYIGVGLFGSITIPFLLGAKTRPILGLLPIYTLAMACFSLSQTIVGYHQSRKEYAFANLNAVVILSSLASIIFFHDSIMTINLVIAVGSISSLAFTIFMHLTYSHLRFVFANIMDFFGLFAFSPKTPLAPLKLRILVFNWRDTKHIWAGGAESYIHELSKRWVSDGHEVTIFCGNDGKSTRNETIDGVNIIRRGGFYTVYFWAVFYYVFNLSGNFDVVVDSENGVPFFTPLFVRTSKFLLIHHVHQEVFRSHLKFPLSQIALFLESKLMPYLYRKVGVITVSKSSQKEILKLGFKDKHLIHVVRPGVEFKKFTKMKKTTYPSILFLGRLMPYKHVDVAISAFAKIYFKHQTAKFTIAGEGVSLPHLQTLVTQLSLSHRVSFLGKVSESEKIKLLSTHWLMVQPSQIEGWGMTVIESNAAGTPVIASNVNGLKDSVIHGTTGILIAPQDTAGFARMMELLIENTRFRNDLSKQAREFAKTLSWDEAAAECIELFMNSDKFAIPRLLGKLAYSKQK